MAKSFKLGTQMIGEGCPAYIIAEAGANHNGEISIAKEMVVKAKEIGCDCIKFQTFTAKDFCADKTKTYTYKSQGKDVTESEYEMFTRLEFSKDEWAELMSFCKEQDIFFMTTVQDPPNLDMMLELGLEAIKVGSDDFDHLVNLKQFAKTGLPLMISKGMADLGEVDRVVNSLTPITDKLVVFHCVSLYPSEPEFLNLKQINTLQGLYPDVIWGFSDHSQGTVASTMAVGLGAKVIEKHFTLDHNMAGPDQWFSMDVDEMAKLVQDIRFVEKALGNGKVFISDKEKATKKIMRRHIVAKKDIPAGTILSEDTVTFKRADTGEFIEHWETIKGNILKTPKNQNEGIALKDVEFS